MNEREISFESALHWHHEGKQVASTARSVHHTQVILRELNEAIELLRKQDQNDITQFTVQAETAIFLDRHTGAPYK